MWRKYLCIFDISFQNFGTKELIRHLWTHELKFSCDPTGWWFWSHTHHLAAAFKAKPAVAFVVVLNERRADKSYDPHLDTELKDSPHPSPRLVWMCFGDL